MLAQKLAEKMERDLFSALQKYIGFVHESEGLARAQKPVSAELGGKLKAALDSIHAAKGKMPKEVYSQLHGKIVAAFLAGVPDREHIVRSVFPGILESLYRAERISADAGMRFEKLNRLEMRKRL